MAGAQDSNLEDENQDDLDSKTQANDVPATGSEKKKKTPEQIERERMRRRRRRQRQRIMRSVQAIPDAEKNQTQKPGDAEKVVDEKKLREDRERKQQLREESHPRVLDANVPPDMKFDKPVNNDQGFGELDEKKKKDEEEKLQKEKNERDEKEKAQLKKKEPQDAEKQQSEKQKKSEQQVVEEESPKIEEPDEPVAVYHPEPSYTTNSFAFEESKTEKPLSEGIQAEPDIDLVSEEKNAGEPDLELVSEVMDKGSVEPESQPQEIEEQTIEVSETEKEPAEDAVNPEDEAPVLEEESELELNEEPAQQVLADDKDDELDLTPLENPEDDTLVPADSVVDEVPIFPTTEENAPAEEAPEDELTFGDSNDGNEGPLIPTGKMREDHGGASADLQQAYESNPIIRTPGTTESPNALNENVEPESKEATDDTSEKSEKKEEANVAEELNEKKAPAVDFAMKLAKSISEVLKKIIPAVGGFFGGAGKFLKGIFGKLNIRVVGGLVSVLVVVGLGYFGFTQKWHEQAWGFVSGTFGSFFKPKAEEPKVEIKPDVNDQRAFGITTGLLFAGNKGAASDRLPGNIWIALYYGALQEPRVQGETGVSAATFFGELRDQADFVNVYVEYVDNLEHMQSLYKTDVYKLLDKTTKRDQALLQHLDELKAMREEGLRIQTQLGINLDDLKVSYESLNGEKNKGESDFFAALADLQGQKSDTLLKQFIEVSQKQVALKARIAALSKLQAYYVTALARLDKRLEAIDKNRDPLIQGIRVVDVPGSDLDLIIREQ